jgi:hypothetical protein
MKKKMIDKTEEITEHCPQKVRPKAHANKKYEFSTLTKE